MFITTPEFLPLHHEQRGRTLKLIAVAEAKGQTRMVEMNRQVLTNLEADEDDDPQPPGEDDEGEGVVADAG